MPRNITAAIENLSAEDVLSVVDLVKVVFPAPIGTVYWSKSSFTYESNTYTPRILEVGSWRRSMSAETTDLTLTLSNADGEITRIWNSCEVEFAQISLIRFYPTLNDAIDPLWIGWGGTLKLDEETAEWSIHFGFRGMSQKAVRRISTSCWKIFNDGIYCPYSPTYGGNGDWETGLCDKLSTAIISTVANTIYLVSTDRYKANDLIKIDDEIMKISSVTNSTTLVVYRGYNSTIASTHLIDTLVKHYSCSKTKQACDRRGMRGPTDMNPITWYNGYRYFGGWYDVMSPNVFIYGVKQTGTRIPKLGGTRGNWVLSSQDMVIPIVYGNYRMADIPAVWSIAAEQFIWGLFIVCEGTVSAVAVNTIKMNDCDPAGFGAFPDDSVGIWWGDIGQRREFLAHHGIYIDSYVGNPYLMGTSTGDGPSLSDVLALYVRIQGQDPHDDASRHSQPTLDIHLQEEAYKLFRDVLIVIQL
jgi:hypothetical protein